MNTAIWIFAVPAAWAVTINAMFATARAMSVLTVPGRTSSSVTLRTAGPLLRAAWPAAMIRPKVGSMTLSASYRRCRDTSMIGAREPQRAGALPGKKRSKLSARKPRPGLVKQAGSMDNNHHPRRQPRYTCRYCQSPGRPGSPLRCLNPYAAPERWVWCCLVADFYCLQMRHEGKASK